MPNHVTLVNTSTHDGRPLPLTVARGDVVVALPMLSPPRELYVGRNADPEGRLPDELDFIAILGFIHRDDSTDAWHVARARARSEAKTLIDSVFAELLVSHEPQLDTELVRIDGASVVRVDLGDHWPNHVIYIPERLLP